MSDKAQFDEYARDYNRTVQTAISASGESVEYFAELKVRLMARALGAQPHASILDFGCGIGNTTRAIASGFPKSKITGFDVSSESVELARAADDDNGRISYTTTSNNQLPFEDSSFDTAFTACVFHHIDLAERLHWARELERVLRPGGTLFFFEHNPFNPLTRQVVRRVPFDEGVVLVKPGTARSLLSEARFDVSPPWFYFFFPALLGFLRPLEPMLRRVPIGAQYFVTARRRRP